VPTWSKLLLLTDTDVSSTANKIVLRDGSGNFSAGVITWSGGGSHEANDSYFDTNTATNANTANKIVKRDGSGNFSANAVTFATVNTGQGDNELYDMDQNVKQNSQVQFGELYVSGEIQSDGDPVLTENSSLNDLTGTLTVSRGGTGAVDAAAARTALGVARSGANSDITSIVGLTTDLAIAHGGTGSGTASGAATNLGLGSASAVTFATVNTGQGANDLYDMNQNVMDTSSVRFVSIGIGRGASGTDGECVIEKGLHVGNGTPSYAQDEIRCEGEVTAFYGSDVALKQNIKPISNPLDKLLSLGGYNFDWKDKVIKDRGGEDGFFVRKKDVGILAHEIEKVIPEIVVTRKDGTKAVKYEKIVPLLIESIKELTAKVTRLENGNT